MNFKLKRIIDDHMQQVPEVSIYCQRCLNTQRWDGNVLLMVVDASFTSIGLNYFHSVVPAVESFREQLVQTGKIKSLNHLVFADTTELEKIWRNRRSWSMAKAVAAYLTGLKTTADCEDAAVFIRWAQNASLDKWTLDPIGKIKGVGINTYQYLRMMGGMNTVMPDKIVKRVINQILQEAGEKIPPNDIEFVKKVEQLGPEMGYKPIELCWMTWLIQSEANVIRMKKHSLILSKI